MILKDMPALSGMPAPRPSKKKAAENILDAIAKNDPAKAAALREKQSELNRSITSLQQSKEDMKAQRKEAARQKVERIKKELEMLRLQEIADPKAAARTAARLSRELSSATKEYAAAGGSATSVASAQVAPAAENPQADAAETQETVETVLTVGANDAASKNDKEKIQREKEEDQAFIKNARDLAKKLKEIIHQLKSKTGLGRQAGQDLRDADHAMMNVAINLNMLSATLSGNTGSVDIFV